MTPQDKADQDEEESSELSDTYRAQMESAMRAGWDDPALNDYARYDELKPQ